MKSPNYLNTSVVIRKESLLNIACFLMCLLTAIFLNSASGQVGIGTSAPNSSAILELNSTSRGFLFPRMTTIERDSINNPAEGLVIYNSDFKTLELFNGNLWVSPVGVFICGNQIQDLDGNIYNTVLIGNQCWMKENLKTTTYRNATPIPNVTDNTTWSTLTTGAYAWYDNDISWKNKYGALYNWFTTVDANGLCPVGWHVPTDAEWTTMTDHIGGISSPHGNELKSCRQVNSPLGGDCSTSDHPRWEEHATHYGTDIYYFSGLPGGGRNPTGVFAAPGYFGTFWSSTGSGSFAYVREIWYSQSFINQVGQGKTRGYSVRCLRDN